MQIPYLTPTEQLVVEMIAQDKSYAAIARKTPDLSPRQVAHLRSTLCRKAGIPTIKDSCYAKEYLANVTQTLNGPGPDDYQRSIIRHVAAGTRGFRLLQDEHFAAMRAAGIFTTNPPEARVQCTAFLCLQDLPYLSESHLRALRLFADGCPINDLAAAMDDDNAETLVREGCDALKVTSRGRGVQRRLVGIALERIERNQSQKAPEYDLNSY